MAITVELVYQALFLSSIFLMAISLPKIVILTLWSIYRVFMFGHVYGWKKTRIVLSEKTIQESLTPEKRLERLALETQTYVSDLKIPLTELLSALIFLHISLSGLTVEPDAANIITTIQVAIVIVFILAVVNLAANFVRMKKIKGGGPLA